MGGRSADVGGFCYTLLALEQWFSGAPIGVKPVVAQLIDSFNQGGSERQALQLTRLLSEGQRFKVHLASLSPEGSLRASVADLDLGNIPSFPLNSFYDHNAVRQLRSCVRWLKELKVDVLHTHDFYTNVFGMTAGMLARVPVQDRVNARNGRDAHQRTTQGAAIRLLVGPSRSGQLRRCSREYRR